MKKSIIKEIISGSIIGFLIYLLFCFVEDISNRINPELYDIYNDKRMELEKRIIEYKSDELVNGRLNYSDLLKYLNAKRTLYQAKIDINRNINNKLLKDKISTFDAVLQGLKKIEFNENNTN